MTEVASPKASRQSLPRWLDPKLILGVLFVAASMVLGAQVITRADQTTEVWAMDADLAVGESLNADEHLVAKRVRFTSDADAQRYLTASEPIEDGARMTRAVGAGELLPKAAVTTDEEEQVRYFPVGVLAEQAPDLSTGDLVDVYAVRVENAGGAPPEEGDTGEVEPTGENGDTPPAELVLSGVRVVEISSGGGLTGGSGTRVTVRVNMEETSEEQIAAAAVSLAEGEAYIVRLPD